MSERPTARELADGIPDWSGEVDLHHETRGQAGPHITIVNDFFLLGSVWRGFTGRLAARGRILTYDLRNQGRSTTGLARVGWEDHLADLRALLDRLGITRTFLLGTSTSTLLCRDFALAHPDRVAGLILVGPMLSPYGGRRRRAIATSWVTTLDNGGPVALWDQLYSLVFSESMMESGRSLLYLGLRDAFVNNHTTADLRANLLSSLDADDDPRLLTRLRCPTLLLLGENDCLWSPSSARRAATLIPRCDIATLDGVGHLPYAESTERFERAVQDFVDVYARRSQAGRRYVFVP